MYIIHIYIYIYIYMLIRACVYFYTYRCIYLGTNLSTLGTDRTMTAGAAEGSVDTVSVLYVTCRRVGEGSLKRERGTRLVYGRQVELRILLIGLYPIMIRYSPDIRGVGFRVGCGVVRFGVMG